METSSQNRHKIGSEKALSPCILILFQEISKKRRKRIRKHAKGRVCAYAREGNNRVTALYVSAHCVEDGKTDFNPDRI